MPTPAPPPCPALRPPRATRLAHLAGPALVASISAMLALHVLQPELDPLREPVSFYVHGPAGWLLPAALATFGLAAFGLSAPGVGRKGGAPFGRGHAPGLRGFGLGMLAAAAIPSDRWFPWEAAPSFAGALHAAVSVVAPLFLAVPLWNSRQTASPGTRRRGWLNTLVAAYSAGLLASGASLALGFALDCAPPLIGLAERFLALSAVGWCGSVAVWRARGATAPASARVIAN